MAGKKPKQQTQTVQVAKPAGGLGRGLAAAPLQSSSALVRALKERALESERAKASRGAAASPAKSQANAPPAKASSEPSRPSSAGKSQASASPAKASSEPSRLSSAGKSQASAPPAKASSEPSRLSSAGKSQASAPPAKASSEPSRPSSAAKPQASAAPAKAQPEAPRSSSAAKPQASAAPAKAAAPLSPGRPTGVASAPTKPLLFGRPEVKGSAIGAQASAARADPALGGGFGGSPFARAAQQGLGSSAARAATGALQRMSPRPSRPPSVPQAGRTAGSSRTLSPAALSAFAGGQRGSEPKDLLPASRRRYPRADIQVKAKLKLAGDHTKFFEAALPTSNISVGGMFLESTFFLKTGTLLEVDLELPPGRKVRVKATVVRVESSETESGFALRFTEYLDGSEVVLATHFLAPVLREFITHYAASQRFEVTNEYVAHTADVLAAWELHKAELGGDVWALPTELSRKQ